MQSRCLGGTRQRVLPEDQRRPAPRRDDENRPFGYDINTTARHPAQPTTKCFYSTAGGFTKRKSHTGHRDGRRDRHAQVHGAPKGHFSSYSFTLMSIFYLQAKHQLPTLQGAAVPPLLIRDPLSGARRRILLRGFLRAIGSWVALAGSSPLLGNDLAPSEGPTERNARGRNQT